MDSKQYKIFTCVPPTHSKTLKEELNKVITPVFDGYDFVFSEIKMTGNWRPLQGSNPHLGTHGQIEIADEIMLGFTIKNENLKAVVECIKSHHPYEKPAIDIFPILRGEEIL